MSLQTPGPRGTLARLRAGGGYETFTRWAEVPMLVLSAMFLAVIVMPVIDPGLSSGWRHVLAVTDVTVWIIFAVEYLIRLVLAPSRRHFFVRNLLDLVVVIVPVLRPVRLVRLARFVRAGALAGSGVRRGRSRLNVDVALQVVAIAVLVIFVGAVGMLDVERRAPGSNIHTFGDALWWALSTVTTVGYGDKYPVTTDGRLIAAAVMLTGIALLGVVTAAVASWFVSNLGGIERRLSAEVGQAHDLEAALAEALTRLARLEAHLGTDPGTRPAAPRGRVDGSHGTT